MKKPEFFVGMFYRICHFGRFFKRNKAAHAIAFIIVAVILTMLGERKLGGVSFAACFLRTTELVGEIVADRLFGGEWFKDI